MSVLGRVLSHLLRRRRERLMLLVGTSGDTGSSAMEAVRGLAGIDILVLYPLQVSPSPSPNPSPSPSPSSNINPSPNSIHCRASVRSRRCRRCR